MKNRSTHNKHRVGKSKIKCLFVTSCEEQGKKHQLWLALRIQRQEMAAEICFDSKKEKKKNQSRE